MRIIRTIRGFQAWRNALHHGEIGLVATMGALHQGHQALIRHARHSCETVVVSVFVNPLQFGPTEDFHRYPRPLKADTTLCRREGVDILLLPPQTGLFLEGFQTTVLVNELAKRWEGEYRPGHFQGVATIVTKLLNFIRPTITFFGQKDYQQTLLVKRLITDLHLGVKVVMCPTIREPDGLACSSRNRYLSAAQRAKAVWLSQALQVGKRAIQQGIRLGGTIQRVMRHTIPRDQDITVDYLAVCDSQTLAQLRHATGKVVLLGAMRLGPIRLLDNLLVKVPTRQAGKR